MLVFSPRMLGRDPFSELRRLQSDMDRAFWDADQRSGSALFPAINLWAGDEGVAVTAEVPGVDPGDIEISVEGDVLRIAGKRKAPENEKLNWHRRERGFGAFARTIQLPFRVDPDAVEARFQNGVLEVLLHRPEADRPRKIAVKTS